MKCRVVKQKQLVVEEVVYEAQGEQMTYQRQRELAMVGANQWTDLVPGVRQTGQITGTGEAKPGVDGTMISLLGSRPGLVSKYEAVRAVQMQSGLSSLQVEGENTRAGQ